MTDSQNPIDIYIAKFPEETKEKLRAQNQKSNIPNST
jgi:hypothetical protein